MEKPWQGLFLMQGNDRDTTHSTNSTDSTKLSTKTTYLIFFLLATILLIFSSCSIERKMAKEYIANDSTRSVLVIPPGYIFKKSLKEWEVESADKLDTGTLDSILLEKSLFLKYVDDSVFMDYYMSNYLAEIEALGFHVYREDSLIPFLSGNPESYIVNIAQLELEEYVMPIKEEEQFGEYIYTEVIDLNAINLNSWFEISRVNADEDKTLFFASHYLTDELEGFFKHYYFTGEVQFSYDVDTLLVDQIYKLAALAGHLYAGYTFDYLMNKYIDKQTRENDLGRSDIFYHYNRQNRYLGTVSEQDRFIPME